MSQMSVITIITQALRKEAAKAMPTRIEKAASYQGMVLQAAEKRTNGVPHFSRVSRDMGVAYPGNGRGPVSGHGFSHDDQDDIERERL